jgi:hypothetical protein
METKQLLTLLDTLNDPLIKRTCVKRDESGRCYVTIWLTEKDYASLRVALRQIKELDTGHSQEASSDEQ